MGLRFVGLWIYGFVCLRVCGFVILFEFMGLWVCGFVDCEFADLSDLGFMGFGFEDLWVCTFVDL